MEATQDIEIFLNIDPNRVYRTTNRRTAARGIVQRNGKFLLIHSHRRNTFEFPGGGIEKNEEIEGALAREINEETGYVVTEVKTCLFKQFERYPDYFAEDSLFEMTNFFFHCEVSLVQGELHLSSNEKYDGGVPVWLDLDTAIQHNREYSRVRNGKEEPWIVRATTVMEMCRNLNLT